MRAVLISLVLLLPAMPVIGQPLSKEECAAAASNDEQFANLLRKMIRVAEGQAEGDAAAKKRDLGPIAEPQERAVAARNRYLDATRGYLKASEDLAYQFRLCAR